jgi:hypothetical protein
VAFSQADRYQITPEEYRFPPPPSSFARGGKEKVSLGQIPGFINTPVIFNKSRVTPPSFFPLFPHPVASGEIIATRIVYQNELQN